MDQKITAKRGAYWLPWGMFTFVVLLAGLSITLEIAGCRFLINLADAMPAQRYGRIATLISPLAFALLGLLIFLYQPGNRIGWIILGYAAADKLNTFILQYQLCHTQGNVDFPGDGVNLWVSIITSLAVLTTLGLFLLTFPNGRFLSPRWQHLTFITLGLMVVYTIWGLSTTETDILTGGDDLTAFVSPLFIFLLLGFLALFLRWYYAQGVIRQQIKWLVFFLMTFGTFFIMVEVIGVFFYPAIFEGWFYFFDVTGFILGFPIVFGIAIFKYRLYDIDIIIRRTVQYSIVSAVLAAVYFGSITLIQGSVTAVTNTQSPLAIVLSTLLIAALFNPLRRRVQTAVDRRFYRKKYDAQQVLAHFAQVARDETEMEALTAELIRVVQETMQPETVSVWLKESKGGVSYE